MKPLARLHLSRQRLYEKTCDPSTFDIDDDTETNDCEVTEWSDWSACSVTCGKGIKYKQRGYKNRDSRYNCKRQLTQRAHCEAPVPCRMQTHSKTEDPECELTDWGQWSSCSVTCGKGVQTRSRRYKNRSASKRCAASLENPKPLEQTIECEVNRPGCDYVSHVYVSRCKIYNFR